MTKTLNYLRNSSKSRRTPPIICAAKVQDSKVSFSILNPGNAPAFDLDAYIIGYYFEEDIDIPRFLVKYLVRECPDSRRLYDTVEGAYGVYDRL